ncbi:hypothetical protein FBR43_02430 [Sphingomonas baiyangensis]|uniref:Uncharacterized protein n=1 Tax=Sphingomonas baiyangensis TaxID=2572576 RepID=A0A4V5PUC4_9SPHN|nr:hypothetical protein FBR43_02430 [Sphingomonas baiyangensis]
MQAPLVVDATIRSAARIKGAEAGGLAPGYTRFYVEADVLALIRGDTPVPPRVGWLVDAPNDARGRPPRLRRLRVIAFARPVPGRPAQLQLVTPQSQFDWTPQTVERVRQVVRDTLAPGAPPAITGIGNAFHVPGSLPGEGETQIFLLTANNDPVSLSILRRPGEERRWAVALGEIVDDAAGPPQRDTLLWYRLACGLPRDLPATSTANEEPARAAIAREDYRFVLDQLGPCRETPGDAPLVMR